LSPSVASMTAAVISLTPFKTSAALCGSRRRRNFGCAAPRFHSTAIHGHLRQQGHVALRQRACKSRSALPGCCGVGNQQPATLNSETVRRRQLPIERWAENRAADLRHAGFDQHGGHASCPRRCCHARGDHLSISPLRVQSWMCILDLRKYKKPCQATQHAGQPGT